MWLFHYVFALVVLKQVFKSPSFLGDVQIQLPQEVGLRARGVKIALSLQVCDTTRSTVSVRGSLSSSLNDHPVAPDTRQSTRSC